VVYNCDLSQSYAMLTEGAIFGLLFHYLMCYISRVIREYITPNKQVEGQPLKMGQVHASKSGGIGPLCNQVSKLTSFFTIFCFISLSLSVFAGEALSKAFVFSTPPRTGMQCCL